MNENQPDQTIQAQFEAERQRYAALVQAAMDNSNPDEGGTYSYEVLTEENFLRYKQSYLRVMALLNK